MDDELQAAAYACELEHRRFLEETMQSEQINELAAALAVAQGEITGALKDSANPFFKSKYADLASVMEAARTPLSKNGLAVIQTTRDDKEGVTVVTTLAHKSGQWIRGELHMTPVKNDPQGIGSCITYARRYAYAAIVGVAQVDDDGNAATHTNGKGHTYADPRGDGWKKEDTKAVNEYKRRIMDAFESNAETAYEIWRETAEGGHDFQIAVWAVLPKPIQNKLKELKEAA